MRPINIFIGYDKCESVAWHTLVQSIMDNTSYPNIKVTQLNTDVLRRAGLYTRPKDEKKSTEFSYTDSWCLILWAMMAMLYSWIATCYSVEISMI